VSGVHALRMALDPVVFAEQGLGIVADPWQRAFLRSDADRILLNCSRQSGKSTMAAILSLHRALYEPDSLVLVLAPALRQAQELFGKIGEAYAAALGEPQKKYGERRLSLELTNGSRIVTLPGTEKTIRGYSGAGLLILDEAARVADELYCAVRPMLAVSKGRLLMLSTPFGKRGVFFEEWTRGVGWKRFEVPATECPRISGKFLKEEREALGP
jgi:phage terminase large subunit-like protein